MFEKKISYVIILLLLITILWCGCTEEETVITDVTGTIRYLDLEGGFYGIISDDGDKYDPINLMDELEIDGLKVKFSAKILKDQASTHMWGTMIEITEIEKM